VAVLDADKEGFLRSSVSLIQTIGARTQRRRSRDPLRRQGDRLDRPRSRNRSAPGQAGRVQQGAGSRRSREAAILDMAITAWHRARTRRWPARTSWRAIARGWRDVPKMIAKLEKEMHEKQKSSTSRARRWCAIRSRRSRNLDLGSCRRMPRR